jgi:hypothetical protein
MYMESDDFQTVWSLAHNWTGDDPHSTDPNNLPEKVKIHIQRLLAAILSNRLPAVGNRFVVFLDDSTFSSLIASRHIYHMYRCIHRDIFKKSYLTTIRVRRAPLLNWCKEEYIDPPPIWRVEDKLSVTKIENVDLKDEPEGWYNQLTDRRKEIVACLEIAKKVWSKNPNQTYEEVFNSEAMRDLGNPKYFSLNSFKKWSRGFATEYAKTGGRPNKIK